MAAAYTALVSLMNTIDHIQNHPHHSFSFDRKQIDSVRGRALSFLDFIESYNSHGSSKEVEDLEARIASAARLAEDVLESHVVDQILAGSIHGKKSWSFLLNLHKQIKDMKKKVMKVPEKIRSRVDASYRERKAILAEILAFFPSMRKNPSFSFDLEEIVSLMYPVMEKVIKGSRFQDQQPTYSMAAASSRPLTTGKTTMVGFDGYSTQLMDVLTGPQSTRKIISVVGMGGIGKTTLARNVYEDLVILQHFHVRAWATISQEHNIKEIILELLSRKGQSTCDTVDELGEKLYKELSGKRYLIILDDIWSNEVWERIKFFFPDNGNRSRIVMTTRLSYVASHFSSFTLVMDLLDEDTSWKLFCEKTFGEEDCPLHLVEIGKKIVQKCKGLPLSIVVIGGHLKKNSRKKNLWVNVASNMISLLNSGEKHCLSILSLSYNHLPACLKSCFLYMGIFPEDREILVSTLIRFWIAEGFLRSDGIRSLEEIAEDHLKDLVDRNLILVQKWDRKGKILTCNIHDLLRELCLKVAEKEKFFCVLKHPAGASRCTDSNRFLSCLICDSGRFWLDKFRLLKILPEVDEVLKEDEFNPDCLEPMFQHFNLRYIRGDLHWDRPLANLDLDMQRTIFQIRNRLPYVHLPSSISLHWNLQTLAISGMLVKILAPPEIWKMRQLRHLEMSELIRLPDPPPSDRDDDFVMQNLQTLLVVENFRPSEEVCRRIPNIKQLQIYYNLEASSSSSFEYYQNNLGHFHKLESLRCDFAEESNWRVFSLNLTFPSSLQELCLERCGFHWDDLSMIGSLPHLEVLTLTYVNSVEGNEWNPVEGEFLRLKSLIIYNCDDLVYCNADRSHFPVLENLTLGYAYKLAEFPSGIGEIPTLRRIDLDRCSVSAAISAMRMLVEQEELGNDDLRLEVQFQDEEEIQKVWGMVQDEGLESNNFRLKYYAFE